MSTICMLQKNTLYLSHHLQINVSELWFSLGLVGFRNDQFTPYEQRDLFLD